LFRTLRTSEYDNKNPLLFIRHNIAVTTIGNPGIYTIAIRPLQAGKELFKLKNVILEPVR
jgi:alpha-L-fucosidase